ncbi:hypothetical protein JW826_01495 [Candidatus Woesearchaeota archaeon]|nr:hypothetical protein [Candidatus Woesearchaeota archaeon]
MDNKKLLELRAKAKRKKPVFCRKDSNKKARIESNVWRKARGCDNKQRLKRRGHKKGPRSGFRSPVQIRGLDSSGLIPVLVSNLRQFETLTNKHGIIIASVGDRNRKLLVETASKKGLKILNLDASKAIEQIDAKVKERQAKKKSKEEQKKADEKKAKEKAKEKKPAKKEEEKSDASDNSAATATPEAESEEDAKKRLEKEEKDKILTKRS